MKIENISEGQIFKNYKELCKELEIPIKQGRSKKLQMKDLERFFTHSKQGHSIIITKIFETPKKKVDMRGRSGGSRGNGRKYDSLDITHPLLSREWDHKKNKLTPKDVSLGMDCKVWWICSNCNYEWECRLSTRARDSRGCPICNGSKGEKKVANFLKKNNFSFIHQYKFEDLKGINGSLLRFDFAVFNIDKKIKILIEFDGQYHFKIINGDIESYERIVEHDKRKDEYCKEKGIELLRIHYDYYKIINQILALELNISGYEDDLIKQSKKDIISYYNYKIKKMEESQ